MNTKSLYRCALAWAMMGCLAFGTRQTVIAASCWIVALLHVKIALALQGVDHDEL